MNHRVSTTYCRTAAAELEHSLWGRMFPARAAALTPHVSHVTCDPRHGARTVDALPASVYNHTVARPDLRHRAPDPATFSQIIGNLTIL